MGKLRLVERGTALAGKFELPAFYMNDFSVLGIVVQGVQQAKRVLVESGYTVDEYNGTTWVCFEKSREMQKIVTVLKKEHIPFMITDLMGCAYQG